MKSRDYRDIVGGALLLFGGLAFSWFSATHYRLETFQNMGPGMFPMILGLLLAGTGALSIVPALFRPAEAPEVRVWVPLFVLGGVAAFALIIEPFGFVPAIVAVVSISSLAERKVRPFRLAVLCAALCVVAIFIFKVILHLPLPLFRWPL